MRGGEIATSSGVWRTGEWPCRLLTAIRGRKMRHVVDLLLCHEDGIERRRIFTRTRTRMKTLPPPLPVIPPMTRSAAPRFVRVRWFAIGFASAVTCGLAVLVVAAVGWSLEEKAAVSEFAKMVACPLVEEGTTEPTVSDAELLASIDSRASTLKDLAERNEELAPVATECVNILRALQNVASDKPSLKPLFQAGVDTWRGSLENDDRGFWLGILGGISEAGKIMEYHDKLGDLHSRVVACRLRVAEAAVKQAAAEAGGNTVTAGFAERTGFNGVENDTLSLRNVSGQKLTNVMVVTELVGESGERFSNLYYAEVWEPEKVMLALCRSAYPGRETVRDVMRVRFHVLADQLTSRVGEIQNRR